VSPVPKMQTFQLLREIPAHSPVPRINGDSLLRQGRGNVILGGERIAARPGHLGPGRHECSYQSGRLFGDVEASRNALSLERLAGAVFFAEL